MIPGIVAGAVAAAGPPPGPWDPSMLSGLAAWWDPSDSATVTLTSGRVSALADKSGNGNTLTEVGTSGPPLGTIDGKDALNVGTGNGLQRVLASPITGPDIAGFMAFQKVFPSGSYAMAFQITTSGAWGDGTHLGDMLGSGNAIRVNVNTYSTAPIIVTAASVTAGTAAQLGFIWDDTADVLTGYLNAVPGTPLSKTSGVSHSGKLFLGGADPTGSYGFAGHICEFILLDTAPSTGDRQKIEGYLAWKWGCEALLPGGHPYAGAPP